MSGYQGNTVLESGKFRLKKTAPLMYMVERKTSILLGGGGFAFDRDVYETECSKWYNMRPETAEGEGHNSWWMRLQDLYQGKFDRAFWCARKTIDRMEIPAPLTTWYSHHKYSLPLLAIEQFAQAPQAGHREIRSENHRESPRRKTPKSVPLFARLVDR
jgi:hypothetical protein